MVGAPGAVGAVVVVIRVFFGQSFVAFGPHTTISPTVRILLPSSTRAIIASLFFCLSAAVACTASASPRVTGNKKAQSHHTPVVMGSWPTAPAGDSGQQRVQNYHPSLAYSLAHAKSDIRPRSYSLCHEATPGLQTMSRFFFGTSWQCHSDDSAIMEHPPKGWAMLWP